MIDHIVKMEARILDYVARRLPGAGILALDVAAAFPSLSRRYIFWVLRCMRIPQWLYILIKNLHHLIFA